MEWMAYKLYFPFIKLIYKPNYEPISMERLCHSHPGSLAKEAWGFLTKRNISLFYGYEVHDLKHVVLDIDMTIKGEILMEYFELGNGNKSIVAWIVVLFGTIIMPENINEYIRSYKRGKKAVSFKTIKLENMLDLPLTEIQKQLGI